MIPFNNFSVIPFYTSLAQQNANKWWIYNRVYPLFTPSSGIVPFQILVPHSITTNVTGWSLINCKDGEVTDLSSYVGTHFEVKSFADYGYDVVILTSTTSPITEPLIGRFYYQVEIDQQTYFSDVITAVSDITPFLKIEWWDDDDFYMPEGIIAYKYGTGLSEQFKNVLYLPSDIAKPEYIFEEEGETRDGFFFPTKQISEKRYRFSFFASEYLLDVMRFIRMADHVQITYQGHVFYPDTFLITPEWEANGDVASVDAQFDCATVAKKIGFLGSGYTPGPTPPGPEPPDPPTPTENGDYLTSDFNGDFLV